MNLLIVSNTPHYRKGNGTFAGWGPTVRENDTLAGLFERTLVLGFLHQEEASASVCAYTHPGIVFRPLKPSGGSGLGGKLSVLRRLASYIQAIHTEASRLKSEDWIYVRCPSSLGLIACFYLILFRSPRRWFKYAGNWKPKKREALSYALQRFLLIKNWCAGNITVNGEWPGQPQHVLSFLNPCVYEAEVRKSEQEEKVLSLPYEFLFAGRVEEAKGVGRLLKLARLLKSGGMAFTLRIAGDGPERSRWESKSRELNLEDRVVFLGSLERAALIRCYRRAHLFLFPSTASEGWPKVLSEAMLFGCVPVAGKISSIPLIIARFKSGIVLPPEDMNLWQDEIRKLLNDSGRWTRMRRRGVRAGPQFTYEYMRKEIWKKIIKHSGNPLPQSPLA